MLKKFINLIHPIKTTAHNRKLMGVDKHQNHFYQCFDNEGKDTHRIVEITPKLDESDIDPAWEAWLSKRTDTPPDTERMEELEEAGEYLKHLKEEHSGTNIRGKNMMNDFKKKLAYHQYLNSVINQSKKKVDQVIINRKDKNIRKDKKND